MPRLKRVGQTPKNILELTSLWLRVRQFIIDRDITCQKSIWQCDRTTQDIEEFICDLCDEIGYAKPSK